MSKTRQGPFIYLDMPRSTPRRVWKALYRLGRIAARESGKATTDMFIYGSGMVFVDENGEARHLRHKGFCLP